MSEAASILGLLADHDRLSVVGALVLGAETADSVGLATGLDARRVMRALARLQAAAVVAADGPPYRVDLGRLASVARQARQAGDGADGLDRAPEDTTPAPLRSFVRDGRLTAIPAAHGKRLVVLEWLSQRFEPGERYPEKEVNARLSTAHSDVAALRRYLVDEGFLDRRDGIYWRSGGPFEVD